MDGIELIRQEREEQLNKHGYSVKRDVDLYKSFELYTLIDYLLKADNDAEQANLEDELFPDVFSTELRDKLRLKTPLEKMIIVGALAAAEIDRQQYIATHGK